MSLETKLVFQVKSQQAKTWFTPDMVETIAAAIIRRLATKDCKTPRNYALNDDTGTPSSQNYKANSNQSV